MCFNLLLMYFFSATVSALIVIQEKKQEHSHLFALKSTLKAIWSSLKCLGHKQQVLSYSKDDREDKGSPALDPRLMCVCGSRNAARCPR